MSGFQINDLLTTVMVILTKSFRFCSILATAAQGTEEHSATEA